MARAVEQITSAARVQIEEDARYHNDLLLKTGLEEVQAIVDALGKLVQIQPEVKRAVWSVVKIEAHGLQTVADVIPFHAEMGLERLHLVAHLVGLQHRNSTDLERDIRPWSMSAVIKVS